MKTKTFLIWWGIFCLMVSMNCYGFDHRPNTYQYGYVQYYEYGYKDAFRKFLEDRTFFTTDYISKQDQGCIDGYHKGFDEGTIYINENSSKTPEELGAYLDSYLLGFSHGFWGYNADASFVPPDPEDVYYNGQAKGNEEFATTSNSTSTTSSGVDTTNVDYRSGYAKGYDDAHAGNEQAEATGNADYDRGYQEGYTAYAASSQAVTIPSQYADKSEDFKKGYQDGVHDASVNQGYEIYSRGAAPSDDYKSGYNAGYFDRISDKEEFARGFREGFRDGSANNQASLEANGLTVPDAIAVDVSNITASPYTSTYSMGPFCGYNYGYGYGYPLSMGNTGINFGDIYDFGGVRRDKRHYRFGRMNCWNRMRDCFDISDSADSVSDFYEISGSTLTAYQKGYQKGWKKGYKKYVEGYTRGYKKGYRDYISGISSRESSFAYSVEDEVAGTLYKPYSMPNVSQAFIDGYHDGYAGTNNIGTTETPYQQGYRCGYTAGHAAGSMGAEAEPDGDLDLYSSLELVNNTDFLKGFYDGYSKGHVEGSVLYSKNPVTTNTYDYRMYYQGGYNHGFFGIEPDPPVDRSNAWHYDASTTQQKIAGYNDGYAKGVADRGATAPVILPALPATVDTTTVDGIVEKIRGWLYSYFGVNY